MRRHPTDLIRAAALLLAALMPWAAQAIVSKPHSYEEASTGYFRDQDTLPGAYRLYLQSPESRGGVWGLGPAGEVQRSSFRADAHEGVRGYAPGRGCEGCHEPERHSLHSSRGAVTCIQCHRDRPIAGIQHYYSPMNPIRRHAYVCAKCHEGASASFATYVVHEPPPLARDTGELFPLFHYGVWLMVILAGGVFAIFIPYVTLWGLRELVGLLRGEGRHSHG